MSAAGEPGEAAARAGLLGAWLLESCRLTLPGCETEFPFGKTPQGAILYTRNGWMACQMAGGGASSAYCGPYAVDEAAQVVTHKVALSNSPAVEGEQARAFAIAGKRLALSATMGEAAIEVVWTRPDATN